MRGDEQDGEDQTEAYKGEEPDDKPQNFTIHFSPLTFLRI